MNVVALRPTAKAEDRRTLIEAIVELHALITLDPVLGASPVRIYFVVNPQAQAKVRACAELGDSGGEGEQAIAMIAYDFPFALQLLAGGSPSLAERRAKHVIELSAGLQAMSLSEAATALGIEARAVTTFDATTLKDIFFPHTQETVAHLFDIRLHA